MTSKKAHEKLIESEKRLRFALEATNDGLFDWNQSSGDVYFSPKYYAMLGYAPNEFKASLESWTKLVHPDDLEFSQSVIKEYYDGKRTSHEIEYRIKTKNGKWKWVLSKAKAVEWDKNKKPIRIVGTHTDITSSKKTKKALHQSLETSRDIVYSIPAGLFIYQYESPDKLYLLDVNPEAEKLTGVRLKKCKGKEFNEIWPKAVETGVTQKFLSPIHTGKLYETEDLIYQDNQYVKEKRWYRVRAFVMPGEKLGVSFEDITSKKKADIKLQDALQEVLDLNREIEKTQEDILYTLAEITAEKSAETGNHIRRVSQYTYQILKLCGYNEKEARLGKIASMMHDIGKLVIPRETLHKHGKLSPTEKKVVKNHTTIGYNLFKKSKRPLLRMASLISLLHHERPDGKGYPRGIKLDRSIKDHQIPIAVAVSDTYDAMRGKRSYHTPLSEKKAIEELKKASGTQFDSHCVDIFIKNRKVFDKIFKKYPD